MAIITNKGFSTTKGRVKFVSEDDFSELEIQFFPTDLQETRNIRDEDINSVGRNTGSVEYIGGSDNLSLTLNIISEVREGKDVVDRVNWLRSFTYSDIDAKPKRLYIIYSEVTKNKLYVVRNLSVSYGQRVWKNFNPREATISLTLLESYDKDLTATDIISRI